MAPPSQLSIATASVIRLLKEETSYRTELEGQRKRLHILQAESGDDEEGNRAWNIGQEARALHKYWLFQKHIGRLTYEIMGRHERYKRQKLCLGR